MIPGADTIPDDIAALVAEQLARCEAEARASDAEPMVAHLKLIIAKPRHEQFGASSEHGDKLLNQLELQLEELKGEPPRIRRLWIPALRQTKPIAARAPQAGPWPFARPSAARAVVILGPAAYPCCQGTLSKLGEDARVGVAAVQGDPDYARENGVPGVRDDYSISGAVPPDACGRAGLEVLATILEAKVGQHLLLHR